MHYKNFGEASTPEQSWQESAHTPNRDEFCEDCRLGYLSGTSCSSGNAVVMLTKSSLSVV
jgi:hypothetical protein